MKWFEGGIAEAVNASKEKNAVFVVFVEGKDDASKKTTEAINSPDVSAKLQSSGYVAIRIESDTTAHQQFAQIYQIVPVPSLFFIGNSGLPIEILAGATDSQTLLGRLEVVEAVHAGRQAPSAAPSSASTAAASTPTESASKAPTERQATKAPHASATSNVVDEAGSASTPPSSETSEKKAAPIEERVERAKELLEKKRLEKTREEQEEQRRKEIERRKMGKDVQEMKKQHQEQELKQLQEQRRKEKEDEALARQRVLDQIAQDRANRSAQTATAAAQRSQSSASTSELTQRNTTRVNDGSARLQFRLPDGSTHTSSFEATSSLGQVRSYLTANVQLPFRSFVLSTTFPRREYREEDNSSTLQDLGLVPTAVMLVIPASGAGVVQNARPAWGGIFGAATDALWAVLSPAFMVLTYLRNRLFGDRQIDQGSSTTGAAGASSSSPDARKERRNKRSSTGGTVRRTGSSNIHRLHQNHSSSDDDNNTWNGNSTQQM